MSARSIAKGDGAQHDIQTVAQHSLRGIEHGRTDAMARETLPSRYAGNVVRRGAGSDDNAWQVEHVAAGLIQANAAGCHGRVAGAPNGVHNAPIKAATRTGKVGDGTTDDLLELVARVGDLRNEIGVGQ